jgi:hypothetical protein
VFVLPPPCPPERRRPASVWREMRALSYGGHGVVAGCLQGRRWHDFANGTGGRNRTRVDAVLETAATPLSYTRTEATPAGDDAAVKTLMRVTARRRTADISRGCRNRTCVRRFKVFSPATERIPCIFIHMERDAGIEPAPSRWQRNILPLNQSRI